MPDRWDQPANRETLATRPHNHEQQRPAAALSACDHHADAGDLGAVPVRGRAGRDRRPAPGRGTVCGRSRTRSGRSPSTVSRELRRNRDQGSGQYRPFTAQRLAEQRRARPRPGKLARDAVLREFVQDRLEQRWSPEQISQMLRRQFPAEPRAARRPRDDLPGDLPAGPGWAARATCRGCCAPDGGAASRAGAPTPAVRPAGRHDDDRSAARRGSRPQRCRALGR